MTEPKEPPAAPSGRAGRTRDAIVDQAVLLFNARGINAVTTNHIAAELGISPGNLYYHFRNKEEIVRAAYARYWAEADALLERPVDLGGDAASVLSAYTAGTLSLILRWPFFFEDMAELCRRDAALARDLREMQRRWVDHLAQVLTRLRGAGLVAGEVEDADLRLLAGNTWMVARGIIEYARNETDEALDTQAAVKRGVHHIFALVRPYLTEPARAALDQSLRAS